jgi:hypothetical protein
MTDLDPKARSLIDAARPAEGPSARQRKRLRGVVLAQVGAAVALGSATTGSAAAAGTTGAAAVGVTGLTVGLKVLLAVSVIAGASSIAYMVLGTSATKGLVVTTATSTQVRMPTPTSTASTSTPTASATTAMASVISAPPSIPTPSPSAILTAATAAMMPSPPQATASVASRTLDIETSLLAQAQAAMASGHPADALRALDEHAARFPGGVLAEEREVQRIVALCDVGRRDEARAAAQRFLQERPESIYAGKVRVSCAGNMGEGGAR